MANTKNTYDSTRDLCLGPVLLVHLNAADGARVGNFGEGVESFGLALRQMIQEDGTKGPIRVSVHGAFVAKKAGTEKFLRWIVGADSKATCGVAQPGQVCLGAGIGRLDPQIAAALYPIVAAFATKAMAALGSRKAA